MEEKRDPIEKAIEMFGISVIVINVTNLGAHIVLALVR